VEGITATSSAFLVVCFDELNIEALGYSSSSALSSFPCTRFLALRTLRSGWQVYFPTDLLIYSVVRVFFVYRTRMRPPFLYVGTNDMRLYSGIICIKIWPRRLRGARYWTIWTQKSRVHIPPRPLMLIHSFPFIIVVDLEWSDPPVEDHCRLDE
jgi:hypothetical protein